MDEKCTINRVGRRFFDFRSSLKKSAKSKKHTHTHTPTEHTHPNNSNNNRSTMGFNNTCSILLQWTLLWHLAIHHLLLLLQASFRFRSGLVRFNDLFLVLRPGRRIPCLVHHGYNKATPMSWIGTPPIALMRVNSGLFFVTT